MPPTESRPGDQQAKLSYTVPEAARMVGVGRTTMWKKVRDGDVRSFKWGGRVLIRYDELQRTIDQASGRET